MKIGTELKKLFSKGEKTLIQKQILISMSALAVFLVGIIVYFAFVAPAVAAKQDYVPALLDGEEIYNTDTILMVPKRTRGQIISLEVRNSSETYKLIAKDPGSESTAFYLEGNESLALNVQNVASEVVQAMMLVTNCPNIGTQDRVNEKATLADLSQYGLDEASNPTELIVTGIDEKDSYKIYIGTIAPMGDGYYAMVDGRRNVITEEDGTVHEYYVVYSLTTSIASTFVSQPSAQLLSTYVLPYFSTGVYQTSNFVLSRLKPDGSGYYTVVKAHTITDGNGSISNGQTYALDYPAGYLVNETTLSSTVLSSMEYLAASEMLQYGEAVHKEEIYSQYGLDLDKDRLAAGTEKCVAKIQIHVEDVTDSSDFETKDYYLYFGNLYYDESGVGYRYAYSPYNETIFTVTDEAFGYISWSPVRFISARMFFDYITSLDYIDMISSTSDIRYSLTGNYMTGHVDVVKASDPETAVYRDGEPLTFTVEPVIKTYGSYTTTEFEGEYENFRAFFYVLITREFAVDVDVDSLGETISDTPSKYINLKTTNRDSKETFYRYDKSGNRMYSDEGKLITAIYDGGYIECFNVKVYTKGLDGNTTTLTYDSAYYDEEKNKFFLKVEDLADGNYKPLNYKIGTDGHLSDWQYINGQVEAEYTVKEYSYQIYDLLYDYTDANGVTTQKVDQTYAFVVPVTTEYTYRINVDGTVELVGEEDTTIADGLVMRTSQIDKLFSDSDKLLNGVDIDKFSPN